MQPRDPQHLLKSVFGYDRFRGFQREVIDHVAGGGDALVLMPTGGGKSVPARARVPPAACARAGWCGCARPGRGAGACQSPSEARGRVPELAGLAAPEVCCDP